MAEKPAPPLPLEIAGGTTEEKLATLQKENEKLKETIAHQQDLVYEAHNRMGDDGTEVPTVKDVYVPKIGKAKIPGIYPGQEHMQLTHHLNLVRNPDNDLNYGEDDTPAFDGIISQIFKHDDAFSDARHKRAEAYLPLQTNIAVLRNVLLPIVLDGVDDTDPKQKADAIRKLEQMGAEIGKALQRDASATSRPGSAKLDMAEASEPGVGAAKMYALLLEKQEKNSTFHSLKSMMGYDYMDWGLPPLENSPFSKSNVDALQQVDLASPAPLPPQADAAMFDNLWGTRLSELGAMMTASASLENVRRMPAEEKAKAVDEARKILQGLQSDIQSGAVNEWLQNPNENYMAQTEEFAFLADRYASFYSDALAANPDMANNPQVIAANEAVGKLTYMTQRKAINQLLMEGRENEAMAIADDIQTYPASWKQVDGVSVQSLLSQMETGMELAVNPALAAKRQQQAAGSLNEAARLAADQANVVKAKPQQAPQQPVAPVGSPARLSPEALKQLLVNAVPLDRLVQIQNEAASMPYDPVQEMKHVRNIASKNTGTQKGSSEKPVDYRDALRQQQNQRDNNPRRQS